MKKKSKIGISPAVTHFPTPKLKKSDLTNKEKIEIISAHFKKILETLGLDLTNESLSKTPNRVAKMFVEEAFSGLDEDNFPSISFFEDDVHYEHQSRMVFLKVSFTSFCEHHFVPMTGYAYVAYIPKGKLIGLSKIPRLVRYFAQRPQLQERLTAQIADSMAILLEIEDVAVSITARHHCVMARGIENEKSHTITNVLRGEFHSNKETKKSFFEALNRRDLD